MPKYSVFYTNWFILQTMLAIHFYHVTVHIFTPYTDRGIKAYKYFTVDRLSKWSPSTDFTFI